MKRIWAGLILITALTVFGGCGGSSRGLSRKNPVTLSVWHYYNGPQKASFDALVKEFNDTLGLEKGIIVEAFSQGSVNDLMRKINESINRNVGSDDVPDIFAAYADTAYQAYGKGLTVDFSQYLSKDELHEYIDSYIEEGRFGSDGGYYLFPIAKSTEVLVVNKTAWDSFRAATGVSEAELKTWEGITRLGKLYYQWTDGLTPEPNDGKAFFGRDAFANYMIIGSMQLGRELFLISGDGTVRFNIDRDVMRRLWDNYYIPYVQGHFLASGRFRSDDMRTGDIIAFVGSTSGAAYLSTEVTRRDGSSYPIAIKSFALPNFENTPAYAVQQGAGMVITKSDETREYGAVLFLRWLTEAKKNTAFSIDTGYLPVKKAANTVDNIKEAIAESETAISPILDDILTIAVTMTGSYELYTSKAFPNGLNIRNFVENSLYRKARQDRAAVLDSVGSGKSPAEAAAAYINDENFEEWLREFSDGLENLKNQE
ncbi:ABC transporter substrate-binding protein [Breznakiella homolactica]|uniref:Extracellular solute-binding protein n=1 Tax=Breznakiella homolactica TaxID=2798577 RepID=A0A7T7XRF3_9SPIR|nr:extracellular solute-binding protein [Breznakiella homolactica]QQO11110.1 extracellular solute-binding protein [Breznakiella homolactica]